MKSKAIETRALALLLALACARLLACGPFFPNNLLRESDTALLVAPWADFTRELARLKTTPAVFHAVTNEYGLSKPSLEMDLADLAAALKESDRPDSLSQAICASYRMEREKLRDYLSAVEVSNKSRPFNYDPDTHQVVRGEPILPMPPFPEVLTPGGLPDEFADYFEGAVAWTKANVAAAQTDWERLLARPEKERRFKSTWAAFMLAKSFEQEDPEKAVAFFRQVRILARHGFVDSAGLAALSLGEEGRVRLNQGKLEEALELYLEEYPTGEPTAVSSLHIVAARAVHKEDAELLRSLAANPGVQPVITAYLISDHVLEEPRSDQTEVVKRWLAAVETANAIDVDSAEKLALAAYQGGDWEGAQRWIDRARTTPVTQWLQAKLLLRAGKTAAAAAMLAKVAVLFPPGAPPTNAPAQLFNNLTVQGWTCLHPNVDAAAQVSGELGVFHLARREYTEALDVLLRAGFWENAAYVAERVLTADELMGYVARNWPVPTDVNKNSGDDAGGGRAPDLGPAIRGLLARRLARLNRAVEARGFFAPVEQAEYDALEQALARGWDTTAGAGERADAFFAAARLTRSKGMELFATELEPDRLISGGIYNFGFEISSRTNEFAKLLPASDDELRRAKESAADPDTRYHYRFMAAAMAWQAALLMPDNSDATARVLCEAGTWIKYLDPQQADVFYKALVRRCRKTAIGDQADKMRWFPFLDQDGNPIRRGGS